MIRVLLFALAACADPLLPCGNPYEADPRSDVTAYRIKPTARTPDGILVDDPRGELDHARVDATFDAWEARTGTTVIRCAVVVVVPQDWRVYGGVQVFPCEIDAASWLCTGAVQHRANLVITPDLKALGHEIDHLVDRKSHGGPYRTEAS